MSEYTTLQEAARRIVTKGVSLAETKLFAINARHLAFAEGDGEVGLGDLSMRLEAAASGNNTLAYVLVVQTEVLETPAGAPDSPRKLAELEVAYGAQYVGLDELGDVSDEEARAFGFTMAALAIWPYVRAVISNTVREMNFGSNALIPMITQSDLAEAAAADAASSEHDGDV